MLTSINDEEFEILSPVILHACLLTLMYLSSIIMLVGIILVGYYKDLCF